MELLTSFQLPGWLSILNMDYVIVSLVFFSLIRSLFVNYRSSLRIFISFTIPFGILMGILFIDTNTLPFLQIVVDTTQQAWIGSVSLIIVEFFLSHYQAYLQPIVTQLPFGLSTLLTDLALVYLLISIIFSGIISLLIAALGSLLDRPRAPKHDDDKPRSFAATPLISILISLLSNVVAVYSFYLFFSLLNFSLGMDVTTGQYLFPFLNQFDPILDKLIAVISAITSI